MLQIGDHDFKPLSMPEALRIRNSFKNKKNEFINKLLAANNNEEKNLESTNSLNLNNPSTAECLSGQDPPGCFCCK